MSKGGDQKVKNVSEPWTALQPYLTGQAYGKPGKKGYMPAHTGVMPEAEKLYKTGPGFATPFDPLQTKGQNANVNFANNFGSLYSPYTQAGMFGLNAPDLSNNPYLEPYMQAATRPLEQSLALSTMPGIRSQFTDAGQYGSSRQGVAEGVAQGLTNQAIGDTRAKIASQAYGQGLDQQAKMFALYPQMMQAGLMPGNILSQVGGERQQLANQFQTDPYQKLREYNSILNPLAQSGGTQSQTMPPSSSGAQDAASVAAAIAALYTAFGSDERLKTDIHPVGKMGPLTIYSWKWNEEARKLGYVGTSTGVMAQEVERLYPDCVHDIGHKVVEYGRLAQRLSE